MNAAWTFRRLIPGEKDRQPTQGEFFATDAIKSAAEALVRESIQNSLDAPDGNGPIRMRFHIDSASPERATEFFAGAWPHFEAPSNGLNTCPKISGNCPFLVVEDFGTTGLIGDITQWQDKPGVKNSFYYFFRTEGRSGKGETDRGRWGIGKFVFPRSSQVNSFMALTDRSDDGKRYLMGQSVLKSHKVGDTFYTPDGAFGCIRSDGLVLPEDSEAILARFSSTFALERRPGQHGLSVVVPWLDSEITVALLLQSVIEDYFVSILSGGLEVVISDTNGRTVLNASTIREACQQLGEPMATELLQLIELADWASRQTPESMFRLQPADPNRPFWNSTLIPADRLPDLRSRIAAEEMVAIEVPLTVRQKSGPSRSSYFRVFLRKDGFEEGRPIFVREEIIISDIKGKCAPGIRSIVMVDHAPLAELLGDSENPAHTRWQQDREGFKFRYFFGKSYIDFVVNSVATIIRYLNEADNEPDRDLLKDFFFIPKPPEAEQPREKAIPRKKNKGDPPTPAPTVEPRKARYTVSRIAGGFTITRGPGHTLPDTIEIVTAYDRRRGSPVKKYHPSDFRLNASPITIECSGVEPFLCENNRMGIRIHEPDFRLSVRGFDENRDLYLSVVAKGSGDDPQD